MRNGSDPNWNVEDYLLDFPDIAWPGGELVDMPLELKVRKVDEYVAGVLREASQCLTIGADLAAAMLSLAVVDYMAGFRHGRKSTNSDFRGFLEEYFPPLYKAHSAWIYEHLRCGLMHNLTAINPYQIDGSSFRLYEPSDPPPIYAGANVGGGTPIAQDSAPEPPSEFAYERRLPREERGPA